MYAEGASVKIYDARNGGRRMINVEVHESKFSIYEIHEITHKTCKAYGHVGRNWKV